MKKITKILEKFWEFFLFVLEQESDDFYGVP